MPITWLQENTDYPTPRLYVTQDNYVAVRIWSNGQVEITRRYGERDTGELWEPMSEEATA